MPSGDCFEGSLPDRALAITFDDGYADNEAVAAPILKDLGLSATFFVSTRFLRGECMWNDQIFEALRATPQDQIDLTDLDLGVHSLSTLALRRSAIETILGQIKRLEPARRRAATDEIVRISRVRDIPRLMMSPDQVRSLAKLGMDVGAHTVTHPILASLTSNEAPPGIEEGKRELEDILARRVKLFAYPNGASRPGLRGRAREDGQGLWFRGRCIDRLGRRVDPLGPLSVAALHALGSHPSASHILSYCSSFTPVTY